MTWKRLRIQHPTLPFSPYDLKMEYYGEPVHQKCPWRFLEVRKRITNELLEVIRVDVVDAELFMNGCLGQPDPFDILKYQFCGEKTS